MLKEEEIKLNTPESDVVLPPTEVPVEVPTTDCGCEDGKECEKCNCVEPTSLPSYFTTIIHSSSVAHTYHLTTKKHRFHVALQEYYEDIPDAIDTLVELYQGVFGPVESGCCELSDKEVSEVEYFSCLRRYVIAGRSKFIPEENTEMWSAVDDILEIIDKLLYLLTAFNESAIKTFEEFCYENM